MAIYHYHLGNSPEETRTEFWLRQTYGLASTIQFIVCILYIFRQTKFGIWK